MPLNSLRSALGGGGSPATSPVEAGSDEEVRALSLAHLRKVFAEVGRMGTSSPEYQAKLCRLFPLFKNLMGMFSATELAGAMRELPAFTAHLSRLFVSEVRKRAANQSTEAAALGIAAFVEPRPEPASPTSPPPGQAVDVSGWFLLKAIEYLVQSNSPDVVEAAVKSSVPSTLAKAVYLFFDLPALGPTDVGTAAKRELIRDLLVNILTKLCGHGCAGEELAKKEDLSLLFAGASSPCPPHNLAWRKLTSQLLITISSRILSPHLIKYIHSKHCVKEFVENVRANTDMGVGERAEMLVVLFCLLKDSAPHTPLLLEDVREAGGYEFLQAFILEKETSEEADAEDAIRNLVLMLSSVVTAGYAELKAQIPTSTISLPGFSVPVPLGQGSSVRNLAAFGVLQDLFLKSRSTRLSSTVLDVVNSIYSADPANFFVLQPMDSLSAFAPAIAAKDPPVQAKFFELLEYVVFHLNHIPMKELGAVGGLVKACPNPATRILAAQTLVRLVSAGAAVKDAYRELGLLGVLLTALSAGAERAREAGTEGWSGEEKTLSLLLIDLLTVTLKGNGANAGAFRELGGGKTCRGLLSGPAAVAEWRQGVLHLLQQLLMLPGGDEDLQSLLGLLHSSAGQDELPLKMAILRALLVVLRESHRVRLAFRRVGGYLYLMSLFLSLQGTLAKPPYVPVLQLLQLVFNVLSISMRFEPANAKAFQTEVRYQSLSESLRLLGCFGARSRLSPRSEDGIDAFRDPVAACHSVFQSQLEDGAIPDNIPAQMACVCFLLRLLYNMALDNYEKVAAATGKAGSESPHLLNREGGKAALFPAPPDSIIVHPGAVCVLLDLLPSVAHPDPKWELAGQLYAAEILKSLVRSERNQQVMCEAGLPRQLFAKASEVFKAEGDLLQPSLYYVLERLSAQLVGRSFRAAETGLVRVGRSRLPESWEGVSFPHYRSDHMLEVDWSAAEGWGRPLIRPYENLRLPPSATALQNAACLFEGMKAYRGEDGRVRLFRPMVNMERMVGSAERAAMPLWDPAELYGALSQLLSVDEAWVPGVPDGSLYIRPFVYGLERPLLPLMAPFAKVRLGIVLLPTTGSYAGDLWREGLVLWACPALQRATRLGGTGAAKMGANYALHFRVKGWAQARHGADDPLYLDDELEGKPAVSEGGVTNIFVLHSDKDGHLHLATPPAASNSILHGVTRDSVLRLAEEASAGLVSVEERSLGMDELFALHRAGRLREVFGTGTASIILPVRKLLYSETPKAVPSAMALPFHYQGSLAETLTQRLLDIQYGRSDSHPDWTAFPIDHANRLPITEL